jgi:hypothetical protein
MTVGANYSKPVLVNGYECWNCSQVADAKKGEDPAHPTTGPDATPGASAPSAPGAVRFGGALASLNATSAGNSPAPPAPGQPGSSVSVFA